MSLSLDRILCLAALVALAGGCTEPQTRRASILGPTQMTPDCVALEILSVRLPPESAELATKIWDDVDEQHLPAPLRKRLAASGFRAGVLSQIPPELSKVMDLKDRTPAAYEPQKVKLAELQDNPRVSPRRLQARAGRRNEVIASAVYEHLPLLLNESGEIRGQTYTEAQGVFSLVAYPQSDGRVQIELVPELHHDRTRSQWVGDQAMWRLESGRPRRTFDELKTAARLTPGSMLIVGAQVNRPGSLGHYFLTETSGPENRLENKLLLVRLCQTQHNDLVNPPPLPLEP